MASTTTNLGLTKPAYSDDADISDINGNMDLIDAEAGRVRANVAANYDSSETYAVGDYCLHDGSLYKCSTAISSPEAWTAGHWTQIKITGELSALNGNLEKHHLVRCEYIEPTFANGYAEYDLTSKLSAIGMSKAGAPIVTVSGSAAQATPCVRACDMASNNKTLKIALTTTYSGTVGCFVHFRAYN